MQEFIDFIIELTDEELYEYFDCVGSKYYFLHGGCYEFAKIIKHFVNKSTIVIDENSEHCGILYKENIYDASGLVEEKEKFKIANKDDIDYMEGRFGIPEKQNIKGKRISKYIIDEIKKCNLNFLTETDLDLDLGDER